MRVKSQFLFILCVLALVAFGQDKSSNSREEIAKESALKWLQLVDNGKYEESWESAAELFKLAVTRQKWSQSLTTARTPLGKVLSREINSMQYTTTLPGAPDGEYVVLQFNTSFKHKKSAIETVTVMKEKDGKWKVAGYFIK